MSKSKEFYVHPEKGICFEAGEGEFKTSGFIHVIEKSEYDHIMSVCYTSTQSTNKYIKENKRLREEIDETEGLFERASKQMPFSGCT